MAAGHGVIINMSNYVPWRFMFNPTKVSGNKRTAWFSAPNIGGAFKKKFFTGFENKEISFELTVIDKESPTGVMPDIAYFEQLQEPDPGILGIAGSFFGNENYPPPQVLFQFGVSMIPLIWDVTDCQIERDLFHSDAVGGIIGIPKRATIQLTLSLDEDNALFKANQIARKASAVAGGLRSFQKDLISRSRGTRREAPGLSVPRRLK